MFPTASMCTPTRLGRRIDLDLTDPALARVLIDGPDATYVPADQLVVRLVNCESRRVVDPRCGGGIQ